MKMNLKTEQKAFRKEEGEEIQSNSCLAIVVNMNL